MMQPPSLVSSSVRWKEFFTRYYKPRIMELAVSDAKMKSLTIEFQDIVRFDVRLSEELLSNPGKVLKDAEDALHLVDLPVKRKVSAFIRIVRAPKKTRIRDLRIEHVNTLVSVDCTVRNITGVTGRIINGAFECARCGNIVYIPQEGSGKFLEPSYCSCNEEKKGVFRLLYNESTFEDYQRIRVQESLEDLDGGSEPQTLECNLNNDMAGVLNPGDRIIVTGILRSLQRIKKDGKSVYFDSYLDVNSFERDREDLDELEVTDEDERMIKMMIHTHGNVLTLTAGSIAPAIYGYEVEKKAIALQLFGGVVRHLPDGTRIRGDIHVLWLGDPGIGKSQVLAAAADKAPRGKLTTGQGSSAAGLTAATVPDDFGGGGYVLEAGVLVLASPGGFVAVDEIDKMRSDDRKKMHGAMEQQIVLVDRAGIHATMRSECAILAAGNPKNGRWDPEESIVEQINLDPAIMSRFDFIFLERDVADAGQDNAVARQMLRSHRIPGEVKPAIDPLLLKKWIALARRKIRPELSDEIEDRLVNYYVEKRAKSAGSTVKVTARQLDGLVRACTASAKMRLSDIVETSDVDAVLELMDMSIRMTCIDENGEVDVDLITVGPGKAQRDRIVNIKNQIRALSGGSKNISVPVDALVEECMNRGMHRDTVEKELGRLREIGEVWMTPDRKGVMLT